MTLRRPERIMRNRLLREAEGALDMSKRMKPAPPAKAGAFKLSGDRIRKAGCLQGKINLGGCGGECHRDPASVVMSILELTHTEKKARSKTFNDVLSVHPVRQKGNRL